MVSPSSDVQNAPCRARCLIEVCRVQGFLFFFLFFLASRSIFQRVGLSLSFIVQPHPELLSRAKRPTKEKDTQLIFRRRNPPKGRRTAPCGPSRIASGYHTGSSDFEPSPILPRAITVFKFDWRVHYPTVWEVSPWPAPAVCCDPVQGRLWLIFFQSQAQSGIRKRTRVGKPSPELSSHSIMPLPLWPRGPWLEYVRGCASCCDSGSSLPYHKTRSQHDLLPRRSRDPTLTRDDERTEMKSVTPTY